MTGRLDAVDLKSDLLLITLYNNPKAPGSLFEALIDLDTETFVFDGYSDIETVRADVQMLALIRHVTSCDGKLVLTDIGERMATILLDELEPDQTTVLQDEEIVQ